MRPVYLFAALLLTACGPLPRMPNGSECSSNDRCFSDICGSQGLCVGIATDDPCTSSIQCDSRQCAKQVCVASTCPTPCTLPTEVCDGSRCVAGVGFENGKPCDHDTNCISGICSNGACAPEDDGAFCTTDFMCKSHCILGSCQSDLSCNNSCKVAEACSAGICNPVKLSPKNSCQAGGNCASGTCNQPQYTCT